MGVLHRQQGAQHRLEQRPTEVALQVVGGRAHAGPGDRDRAHQRARRGWAGQADPKAQHAIDDPDDDRRGGRAEQQRHAQEAGRGHGEPECQRHPGAAAGDQAARGACRRGHKDRRGQRDQRRRQRRVAQHVLGVLLADEGGPEQAAPGDRAADQGDGEGPGAQDLEVEQGAGRPTFAQHEQHQPDQGEREKPQHGAVEAVVGDQADRQHQRPMNTTDRTPPRWSTGSLVSPACRGSHSPASTTTNTAIGTLGRNTDPTRTGPAAARRPEGPGPSSHLRSPTTTRWRGCAHPRGTVP